MARRLGRILYVAGWALVLGALATELALVVSRVRAAAAAERHRERNPFELSVHEGGADDIWLVRDERYRPGAALDVRSGDDVYQIRINSLGYRSAEFTAAKPPGVFRVVCIGGSTTVQGRTNAETYPALLGARLAALEPGRPVEVLNLGINGTRSGHWLGRDDPFRFQPDLVLHYEFVNDLFFDHLPRWSSDHPWRSRALRSLLVARLLPIGPADVDGYLEGTFDNYRRLARRAHAAGARYVLGRFAAPDRTRARPDFVAYLDRNTEAWGGRHGLRAYRDYERLLGHYRRRVDAFAAERGLDLVPVDREVSAPELFVDLCHMTPEGISRMAEAFVPVVREALRRHDGAAADASP